MFLSCALTFSNFMHLTTTGLNRSWHSSVVALQTDETNIEGQEEPFGLSDPLGDETNSEQQQPRAEPDTRETWQQENARLKQKIAHLEQV
jgi:hypothetical protein